MFKFVNYCINRKDDDDYRTLIYSTYSTKVEKGRFKQNHKGYPILYYHKGKVVGGLEITYYKDFCRLVEIAEHSAQQNKTRHKKTPPYSSVFVNIID